MLWPDTAPGLFQAEEEKKKEKEEVYYKLIQQIRLNSKGIWSLGRVSSAVVLKYK